MDSDIDASVRLQGLRKEIEVGVVVDMDLIDTETDLLKYLKAQPHLNHVPMIVKNYFCL